MEYGVVLPNLAEFGGPLCSLLVLGMRLTVKPRSPQARCVIQRPLPTV
jgi:hypothetical protein